MAHRELIDEAFSDKVELARRIHDAMRTNPSEALLYAEIAHHVRTLRSKVIVGGAQGGKAVELSIKKRKLHNDTTSPADEEPFSDYRVNLIFEARDVSISAPMRKKLHLEIVQATSPTSGLRLPAYQVQARNPASGEIEYKMGMQSFKHALLLPVPEKSQKQHNIVLLVEGDLGIGDKSSTNGTTLKESLVWTVGDGPQKVISYDEKRDSAIPVQDSRLIEENLNSCLKQTSADRLIGPTDSEFVSATPEAHRKGEKAYHVKAFRGSKDGYLFFLATGIFFGFKKPLAFFPFDSIHSISYTSVLQRTFNLNISVQLPDQGKIKESEFCMIDQADFAGIDAYIKRHGLHDASLAESRKAKKLNINGVTRVGDTGAAEEAGEESELHKAQQDIEDAEDEEEDDYNPGSEGSSDGSGESSREEDYEGDAVENRGNLVAEELGSDAEDDNQL